MQMLFSLFLEGRSCSSKGISLELQLLWAASHAKLFFWRHLRFNFSCQGFLLLPKEIRAAALGQAQAPSCLVFHLWLMRDQSYLRRQKQALSSDDLPTSQTSPSCGCQSPKNPVPAPWKGLPNVHMKIKNQMALVEVL